MVLFCWPVVNDSSISSSADYSWEAGSKVEIPAILLAGQMQHILPLILVEVALRFDLLSYLRVKADKTRRLPFKRLAQP